MKKWLLNTFTKHLIQGYAQKEYNELKQTQNKIILNRATPKIQYELAKQYENGDENNIKDLANVFIWYRRAANDGHAPSQFWLAKWYLNPIVNLPYSYLDCAQDEIQAIKFLEKAERTKSLRGDLSIRSLL